MPNGCKSTKQEDDFSPAVRKGTNGKENYGIVDRIGKSGKRIEQVGTLCDYVYAMDTIKEGRLQERKLEKKIYDDTWSRHGGHCRSVIKQDIADQRWNIK